MTSPTGNATPSGAKPETSDSAVAQRVRSILERADYDLSGYLCEGGKPGIAAVLHAIDEAKEATVMLGCAVIGSGEYFGGTPSDRIIADWTHIAEQKLEIAKALVTAQEGGDDE